jgi:hypothetical protein
MLTRIPLSIQSMHTTARSAQSQPARVPIGKCAPQPQTPARRNAKTFTALDVGLPVEPIYAGYGLEGLRIRRMNALARRSCGVLAACYVASGCALNGDGGPSSRSLVEAQISACNSHLTCWMSTGTSV